MGGPSPTKQHTPTTGTVALGEHAHLPSALLKIKLSHPSSEQEHIFSQLQEQLGNMCQEGGEGLGLQGRSNKIMWGEPRRKRSYLQ